MGKTQRENVTDPDHMAPLFEPLRAVLDLLEELGDRGVIIGDLAVALLAEPSFTADVDAVFLVGLDELPRLIQQAAKLGILARIPQVEEFAQKNRVLLLRHTASGIDIDISLGLLPFEKEMVKRRQTFNLSGLKIYLPTPEDLIILKAVAHRPKDLLDIESMLATQPEVDKEYVRGWVQQFADALEMPELWDDLPPRIKL